MDHNKEIPKDHGLPLLGHAISFFRDTQANARDIFAKNKGSDVVEVKLLHEKLLLFFHPDAYQMILLNQGNAFSSKYGWEKFIDQVFPGAIMSMDGNQHRHQRRIMQTAFKKPILSGYLNLMHDTAKQEIDSVWHAGNTTLVYPQIKQLLLKVAAPTFLGMSLSDDSKDSTDDVFNAFEDCVDASLALIRKPVRPFKMWKGVQSRKKLEAYFTDLLEEKRKTVTPDLFSQFCHAESEEGDKYTDKEIVDHIIFLMMAAHDTTSSALTTMIYNLGKFPEWQDKARQEVLALDTLDIDSLAGLETIDLIMQESLRLYPSVPTLPRQAMQDVEYKDFTIKKGSIVSVNQLFTHHDERFWTNPELFDPERFSDERAEHKQHRFSYLPFGGGAHKCIGQHFANLQVKIILGLLLKKFNWQLDDNYQMPYQIVPIPSPKDGLPIKFQAN